MQQLSVWVGAGVMTAGVSAALIAGAGAASAATDPGSDPGVAPSSDSKGPVAAKSDSGGKHRRPDVRPGLRAKADAAKEGSKGDDQPAAAPETASSDTGKSGSGGKHRRPDAQPGLRAKADAAKEGSKGDDQPAAAPETASPNTSKKAAEPATDVEAADTQQAPHLAANLAGLERNLEARPVIELVTKSVAALEISKTFAPATSLVQARAADATPTTASALGAVEGLISGVVANVGSAVFDTLQAVETVVTGPPVVPPGSKVTVQTSTIQLDNGETVPANWYFPKTVDGKPPKQIILLQHGFLAQGPMYSYTAASLAESTGSIVVTPTLSSNPFAGDDFWLGGSGMAASIGHLFEGDRAALTKSALDAGYAQAYVFPEGPPQLPDQFALVGHSLGANLVAGAAGTLAADCKPGDCAADNLAGVILLDGVPSGNTLPNALNELNKKEALTGYIPVREIGAPFNAFNSVSSVNQQLTAARPGRFNGVVLDGGVHSDSMSGGNPLIQLALYVVAGFPQPQNPAAVETLSATWLNQWFAGNTSAGDELAPGAPVVVDTPNGTAHGVVIGTPPPFLIGLFKALFAQLEGATVTSIPSVDPTLVTLAA